MQFTRPRLGIRRRNELRLSRHSRLLNPGLRMRFMRRLRLWRQRRGTRHPNKVHSRINRTARFFRLHGIADRAIQLDIGKGIGPGQDQGMDPMSTYEMIKALPGKGTNWRKLVDALSAEYVSAYKQKHDGAEPYAPHTTDEWAAAKGVREMRHAAMYAAACFVQHMSKRSSFIPPSEETLSWGGFLGGEHVSWTDEDAETAATARVAEIIAATA